MNRLTVLVITVLVWALLGAVGKAPAGEILAQASTIVTNHRNNEQAVAILPLAVEENREEQGPQKYNGTDLDLLARLVSAEARGEPLEGQIAVANVVLNRVASNYFPDTITGVIYQQNKGRYQFCPVQDGSINEQPTKKAQEAARLALEGERTVPPEALYFYNPLWASSGWIKTRPVVKVIGTHVFAS